MWPAHIPFGSAPREESIAGVFAVSQEKRFFGPPAGALCLDYFSFKSLLRRHWVTSNLYPTPYPILDPRTSRIPPQSSTLTLATEVYVASCCTHCALSVLVLVVARGPTHDGEQMRDASGRKQIINGKRWMFGLGPNVADAWPCIITAADGSGWTRGRKGQGAGRAREIGREKERDGGSSSGENKNSQPNPSDLDSQPRDRICWLRSRSQRA